MRILHVALGYPPAEGLGGPTKVVYNNASELARRGHRVSVVCTNRHDKRRRIMDGTFERNVDGVHVTYLETQTIASLPGTFGPMRIPELRPWLLKNLPRFDIVHVNGYRTSLAFSAMEVARMVGTPYVVQPHGVLPYLRYADVWKRVADLLYKDRIRHASVLLALSPKEVGECQRLVGKSVPVYMIPNGLHPKLLQLPLPGKFRKALNLPPNTPLVTFLGRVNWIKGPDILVTAFSRCRSEAILAIVGPDDGYLQIVKDMVRKEGLQDKVRFVGAWQPDAVMEVLVDSDLFVLSSRKELFPMALLEACAAGVPCVVADTCEIAPLVANRAALVCPLDAAALSRAIDQLLSDSVLREKLSAGGKNLARNEFSLKSAVDQLETAYSEVLKGQASLS